MYINWDICILACFFVVMRGACIFQAGSDIFLLQNLSMNHIGKDNEMRVFLS
jgi:hypothetical protein